MGGGLLNGARVHRKWLGCVEQGGVCPGGAGNIEQSGTHPGGGGNITGGVVSTHAWGCSWGWSTCGTCGTRLQGGGALTG